MITVKGTREGLLGGRTASGYIVDRVVPFVSLPSTKALGRFVRVVNPANGRMCLAVVLDVGPWNEHDDAYVFQPLTTHPASATPETIVRPAAESGTDTRGRTTNKAGIDLGEKVWHALGMKDNTAVAWNFVDAQPDVIGSPRATP